MKKPIGYIILQSLIRYIGPFFFEVKVTGKENIPKEGPVILAANHTSHLDPPLLGWHLTRRFIRFVALEKLLHMRGWSFLIKRAGCIFVDPDNRNSCMSCFQECIKFLKKSGVILIFPEGGIPKPGETPSAKAGLGIIVHKLRKDMDIPIIPICVKGNDGPTHHKGWGMLKRRTITITIGPRIVYDKKLRPQEVSDLVLLTIQNS